IALTTGEPAGIGPDICIRLAQTAHEADIIALADTDLLAARARQLRLPLRLATYAHGGPRSQQAGQLRVLPVKLSSMVTAGSPDPANAGYVLELLERASAGCLSGEFDAMVTAPVHKGVINDAGILFTGHTEYLAARCKSPPPVMLLVAGDLRVALATTHVPLAAVSQAITAGHLTHVLQVLHTSLRERFGIAAPRILVLGLNPHAGEGGHLGREELEVITPALDRLRLQGMRLMGPVSADSAFHPARLKLVDAVLAMYHDQGLPVLKYAGFGHAVNVTLGLPIIRTSVDHGTALELAGSGHAEHTSLEAALALAIELSRRP
ncbi:MAG: 4-hydroxythreonine-4-phosphate dehydrogenase PdxA, partial [Gammaproteobacteria bacterium]|nr:4-hydroxythreonine-4-phosphate dehydrogenase PdxA [Gammaproteobacteria bacterium]